MINSKENANTTKTKILFLCTGNSCRSQMGEGLARALKGNSLEVWSAGVEAHGLNPYAVKAMQEIDIDISGHKSKLINDVIDIPFDYVITVCDNARDTCPIWPKNSKIVHVGFDDPPALAKNEVLEDDKLKHYRRVRDEIRDFVLGLPNNLDKR